MRVAAIVITYNDGYKLKEWLNHHNEYKHEIYLHVIVDNGSETNYLDLVEASFPDSIIIKRRTNGGCTGAYNDGIKLALLHPEVDAIMLLGNDIRIKGGGITELHKFLFSKAKYGMVQPILLKLDSDIVENYGCNISPYLYMAALYSNVKINEIDKDYIEVEAVVGGMNMAKREFYELVGFQDENLFMYSDEVDMALRGKKFGFSFAATKHSIAWHQHINPNGRKYRSALAGFLLGRNKVYIAKKHFFVRRSLLQFAYHLKTFLIQIIVSKFETYRSLYWFWFFIGSLFGLFSVMKIPNVLFKSEN